MKTKIMNIIGIGIGIVGLGLSGYSAAKVHKFNKAFTNAAKEMSSNIEVDIPKAVVDRAVQFAAERQANLVLIEAKEWVKRECRESVEQKFKENADKLEEYIERELKKEVVSNAADKIADGFINGTNALFKMASDNRSNMADIIKICADADMHPWEIENILKAAK